MARQKKVDIDKLREQTKASEENKATTKPITGVRTILTLVK